MKLINPEVRIENCSICNLVCTICPREKLTRPKVVMPEGHFEYLVCQAKDLGADTISIFGFGEPLLDYKIATKIRFCTEKGLNTFITSNGVLLNTELAHAILGAGLKSIRFSFHGLAATYAQVHQKNEYDRAFKNIINFAAINKIKFEDKCKIGITCIPMNGEKIENIKNLWPNFDLEIWEPHNWINGRDYRKLTKKRKKTCGRPFNGPVQILADGKMVVCCFDFNGDMPMGDTYRSTIEEILKGKNFNTIRKRHEKGIMNGWICDKCDQLNIGDSPLLFSTIDPTCEIGRTSSTKFKLQEN